MRRVVRLTQLLLLSGAFLGPSVAHATLSAHLQRGEKIVDLTVASRNAQVCVIGNVPPTVLRTFDLKNHIALGHKALDQTKSGTLIHQTWAGLVAQLTAGAKANRRDFLLTDDFAQSYGALSENPTKEEFYKEFFNGGANNVARAQNFRNGNQIIGMLARNSDISMLVGRNFTTEDLATKLHQTCLQGRLKLDLDLQTHFS